MDYFFQPDLRKQFSFCETNILIENVNQKTTLGSLIARLDLLSQNTRDKRLLYELENLIPKVKDMNPGELEKLKVDINQGRVIFPPNYTL